MFGLIILIVVVFAYFAGGFVALKAKEIYYSYNSDFQSSVEDKVEYKEDKENRTFDSIMNMIRLRKNAGHDLNNSQEEELPLNEHLTIKTWTELFIDVDWGYPIEMKVLADNILEIETEAETIMTFNIREYIRKCTASAIPQELTIIVVFENQNLFVNLKKEKGSNEKVLFYRTCIVYNGTWNQNHLSAPQSRLSLIEIRLMAEKEDDLGAKALINEALDEWNNGKRGFVEMLGTYNSWQIDQLEIVDCMAPNMELDLYMGESLYNRRCFLQALAYFKRVHQALGYQWVHQTKENRCCYSNVCYYIGSIYMKLGMYDTAYYYLHRAQFGGNVPTIQESTDSPYLFSAINDFTNCLCYMQDVDAIQYIRVIREKMEQALHDILSLKGYYSMSVWQLHNIMERRMIHTLINNGQLEEATTMLQQMISKGGKNVEFARKELAHIEELKKKETKQ